jgi:hypothetical protein
MNCELFDPLATDGMIPIKHGDGVEWQMPKKWQTVYDIDFTSCPTTANFVDGSNDVCGKMWDVFNMTNTTTNRIINGEGWVIQANSNITKIDAEHNCPLVKIRLSAIDGSLNECSMTDMRFWFKFSNYNPNGYQASDNSVFCLETTPYVSNSRIRAGLYYSTSTGPVVAWRSEAAFDGTRVISNPDTTNMNHDIVVVRRRGMEDFETYSGLSEYEEWCPPESLQLRHRVTRAVPATVYAPALVGREMSVLISSFSYNNYGNFKTTLKKFKVERL